MPIKAIAELTEPGWRSPTTPGRSPAPSTRSRTGTATPGPASAREREGALRLEEVVEPGLTGQIPLDGDPGWETIAKLLFTSGSTGRAQGGDQHAAHAVREPGRARRGLAVSRRRAARDRRLAAVESHVRREPQREPRARARRHAATSTAASPRRVRSTRRCATCARYRRRSTSTCRAASICSSARSRPTRRSRSRSSRARVVFYAAAALSPATWRHDRAVARHAEQAIAMTSAWGSTETSPLVTRSATRSIAPA